MSGARGGGRRGGARGGGGGRAGGGGRGNINMTQAELNDLLQQQVNMAMATFQAGINAMGGELVSVDLASFLGVMFFFCILFVYRVSGIAVNPPPPQCSYKKFRDCQPHNFAGTEGAVGLLRWLEKVESVFVMCNCPAWGRVKYATSTFEGPALSWWNATAQNMGLGEAIATPWAELVQLLRGEYCPREEIQKLEHEVWSYKMVGSEIEEYTVRRNELAVLCPDLHTPEYRRIEHHV